MLFFSRQPSFHSLFLLCVLTPEHQTAYFSIKNFQSLSQKKDISVITNVSLCKTLATIWRNKIVPFEEVTEDKRRCRQIRGSDPHLYIRNWRSVFVDEPPLFESVSNFQHPQRNQEDTIHFPSAGSKLSLLMRSSGDQRVSATQNKARANTEKAMITSKTSALHLTLLL